MSDPAVKAARRAIMFQPYPNQFFTGATLATFAAREALKPIREIHKPEDSWCFVRQILERNCAECDVEWPCYTAKFAYTAEELAQ